jgi:hypothetical protein
MTKRSVFVQLKASPEIIRLAMMFFVCFLLTFRIFEDFLHEGGIKISLQTVWYWWHRFGPPLQPRPGANLSRRCAPVVTGSGSGVSLPD